MRCDTQKEINRYVLIPIAENVYAAGRRPMKKAHPGVHPEGDGSKCPSANEAELRPAAAFTDRHTRRTAFEGQQGAGLLINSTHRSLRVGSNTRKRSIQIDMLFGDGIDKDEVTYIDGWQYPIEIDTERGRSERDCEEYQI